MARKSNALATSSTAPAQPSSSRPLHPPDADLAQAVRLRKGPTKKRAVEQVTESQQIVALESVMKKAKIETSSAREFGKRVDKDRRELKVLLEQNQRQAQEKAEERRRSITKNIRSMLTHPGSNPGGECSIKPQYSYTTTTDLAAAPQLFPAYKYIAASKVLYNEFVGIEKKLARSAPEKEQLIMKKWEEDSEHTKKIIELGCRVAMRRARKVLDIANEKDYKGEEADIAEYGEETVAMMKKYRKEEQYELQSTLNYTERAVKRMAKALPVTMTS